MRKIYLPTKAGKPRKPKHKIDMIVIHAMSEYLEVEGKHYHAVDFLNKVGLSCHFMLTPDSSIIECADPDYLTTYHAKGFNTHSIGIEILLKGLNHYDDFEWTMKNVDWISSQQEIDLTVFCIELMKKYKMNGKAEDHIKFHMDLDPTRKVDPGEKHDWSSFFLTINKQFKR